MFPKLLSFLQSKLFAIKVKLVKILTKLAQNTNYLNRKTKMIGEFRYWVGKNRKTNIIHRCRKNVFARVFSRDEEEERGRAGQRLGLLKRRRREKRQRDREMKWRERPSTILRNRGRGDGAGTWDFGQIGARGLGFRQIVLKKIK